MADDTKRCDEAFNVIVSECDLERSESDAIVVVKKIMQSMDWNFFSLANVT